MSLLLLNARCRKGWRELCRAGALFGAGFAFASGISCAAAPGYPEALAAPGLLPPGAAADISDGYGGRMLVRVLPYWRAPEGINGLAQVLVRVSTRGRVLSCEGKNPFADAPGTPVSPEQARLNDAACAAVAEAGPFPPPSHGLIVAVTLSLAAGNLTPALLQPESYAQGVVERALPHVTVPVRLGGEFTARVRLRVGADGGVQELSMERGSGHAELDASILQAVAVPGVVTPPPDGARDLILTFTVRGD